MRFSTRSSILAAVAAATLSFSFISPAPAQDRPPGAVVASDSLSQAVAELEQAKHILGGDDAIPLPRDPRNLRHKVVHDIDIALEDLRGVAADKNIPLREENSFVNTEDTSVPHAVARLLSRADKLIRRAGGYGQMHDALERIGDAGIVNREASETHAF